MPNSIVEVTNKIYGITTFHYGSQIKYINNLALKYLGLCQHQGLAHRGIDVI